jgi:glutaredoxin 3
MEQKKIVVYSKDWCSYSWRAKCLLKHKGYDFEVIDATGNDKLRAWLAEATGRKTVPQIFIGGTPIGGYDDKKAHDRPGELDRLVRSA